MSSFEDYLVVGDLFEVFNHLVPERGYRGAASWFWVQTLVLSVKYTMNSIYWRGIMFKNYLKMTARNMMRYKLYSFLNIFGLAIGIAVCTIIGLWLQRELSYDRFHEKANRIYRIERELFRDNAYSRWPITSGAYKQLLLDEVPEIENAARLWKREFSIKDYNNYVHRQLLCAVDNSIFQIFDFKLLIGDVTTALEKPLSMVLTRENALKYFNTEDVVGKSLEIEAGGVQAVFEVTGVLEELPVNSHVHFDMLISITSYPDERFSGLRSNYLYTYVLIGENTSKAGTEEQLKSFVGQQLAPVYGDLTSQGFDIHEVLRLYLFPITAIHLNPSPNWEIEATGNVESVFIFCSIALLVLIIACINFMNLSTARAKKRAKEVGLRKTVGANKHNLRFQFLQESVLLTLIAFGLGLLVASLSIPLFNRLFSDNLSLKVLFQIEYILLAIGVILIVGIISGLYPAFYLTRFEAVGVLRGESLVGSGRSSFRRNMVVLQFIISITLIIGTFTVNRQMSYIRTRSLGFDKENVLLIPVRNSRVAEGVRAFREELLQSTLVKSTAVSSDLPGETFYSNTNFVNPAREEDPASTIVVFVDYDFVETYGMEMVAGRVFSNTFAADSAGGLLLNEAAVRRFGWKPEEAVGKELRYFGNPNAKIIGVVKDFNYRSLHTEIEPLALILAPGRFNAISVRIAPGNIELILHFIEQKWQETFPGDLFEFSFLDDRINRLYENERKVLRVFTVFSFFSIFVACLGLFGLAAFTAGEKTKEIGIRKVLGASTGNILITLSKDLCKWIIVANVLAWPLAWFIMNKWLQHFAFKANIGYLAFFSAGFIALAVALLTFSFQAVKAALADPVKSLRYE